MKYYTYDVTFQEIPDQVSLTFSITNCPNRCTGCHSKYLQEDIGHILTPESFNYICDQYVDYITSVCFLGGDSDPELYMLLLHIRDKYPKLRLGLYSGNPYIPFDIESQLDYLKLGPFIESLGGLRSKTTNQRFYRLIDGKRVDITSSFWG